MSRKPVFVLVILVLALVVFGLTAFAAKGGKSIKINQDLAGSIFGGIEVSTMDPDNPTVNRTMLNLYAKGNPGPAHVDVVGGANMASSASGLCPVGTGLELFFVDGGIVQTFNDNSMLFYVIDTSPEADNALCIDFQGAPSTGVFDYVITGGAGRFEGATGSAKVKVTSWGITSELSAEIGTLEGMVQLP